MSANPASEERPIQGVVIDPIHSKPGGKVYSNITWRAEEVRCDDLDQGPWYDLLVPQRLGIPLRFKGYKNANEYDNWLVRIMSIDVDTDSSAKDIVRRGGFSRRAEGGSWFGGIILVRDDGRDLNVEDIQVLVLHVDPLNQGFDLKDFGQFVEVRLDDRSIPTFRMLQDTWKKDGNKKALWTYWHILRGAMLEGDNRAGGSELQCPVVVDEGNQNAISRTAKSSKLLKDLRC